MKYSSSLIRDIDKSTKLVKVLESHGATRCVFGDDLTNLTHLISTTSDFPAYHDAVEGFLHVVKPNWIHHSVAKKRAANPRQYNPDPCLFFTDVVVTCADDIPQGDKDAIVGGVLAFGGQYSPNITKVVTHIVALSMNNPECQVIAAKGLRCKPVLPHWFDDCLKLGKKILHEPYLLPNPSVLDGKSQRPPTFSTSKLLNGASELVDSVHGTIVIPQSLASPQRQNLDVFRNKSIYFAQDLDLSEHLLRSFRNLIVEARGKFAEDEEEADTVVCKYREGEEYVSACHAKKDVGNLTWLYYLINNNIWTSPTHRLLHYPIPRKPIPGFEKVRATVSNYTGEARILLENLVKAAGGTYTKTMTQENTHLITAHVLSEKCDAAKEWNINMVNNLWLEESYAKCQIQPLTNPRYTTFPSKTNLCETVGQTEIDREAVERFYFPEPGKQYIKASGFSRGSRKEANGDAATPANKTASTHAKDVRTPLDRTADDGKANETPSSRGAKARALHKLHNMAPDIALFEKERKRTGGVVYGGRKASDPDRVATPKRGAKDVTADASVEVASTVAAATVDDDNPTDPGSPASPPRKKARTKKKAQAQARPGSSDGNSKTTSTPSTSEPRLNIIVTGYEPWATSAKALSADTAKLHALNIHVLDTTPIRDPVSSSTSTPLLDVLVAAKVLRTRKFIVAVSAGPTVASTSWLADQLAQNRRLPPEDYPLDDREGEERNAFVLADGIARARRRREEGAPGVLAGRVVFCTEGVNGGFDALDEIVRANGGVAVLWKGRETDARKVLGGARGGAGRSRGRRKRGKGYGDGDEQAQAGAAEDEDGEDGDEQGGDEDEKDEEEEKELHLVSDAKDKALWSRFEAMATAQGFTPRIIKSDWLLRVALGQEYLACDESLFET